MKTGSVTAPHSDKGRQCYCATQWWRQVLLLRRKAMKADSVTAPHSDEGRQCYCATKWWRQAVLLRHTVMKAGSVTAPHSTNSLCRHSRITATARGRGVLGLHDGIQHAAGEPHKSCTQTIFTDHNKPATTITSTQQCYAELRYGFLADAAIPT